MLIAVNDRTMFIPLTIEQATENRAALLKVIYGLLFQWIVTRVNRALNPDTVFLTINSFQIFFKFSHSVIHC